ncbi:flagellar biosynthesis protein FliO, partial [Burkholderia pseudomallei]|nr:flagellar biosynthesis protein FliO [Burkholderia pseudomallei]
MKPRFAPLAARAVPVCVPAFLSPRRAAERAPRGRRRAPA